MIKVDGKELILSESFMVRNGQDVDISVPVQGSTFTLKLKFRDGQKGADPTANWEGHPGGTTLTFAGWDHPIGSCMSTPQKIGDFAGSPIGFQIATRDIEGSKIVHFFVYLGGTYG